MVLRDASASKNRSLLGPYLKAWGSLLVLETVIYHIQKDSGSLDDQNPPKKLLTFIIFRWSERPLIQFASAFPYNIVVFHFFRQNEIILWGN